MTEEIKGALHTRPSLRSQFQTTRETYLQKAGRTDTLEPTLALYAREQTLRQRAQDHFTLNRDNWILREEGRVLARMSGARHLIPKGSTEDRLAQARKQAELNVHRRHYGRLARIEKAAMGMVRKVQNPRLTNTFRQHSGQSLKRS